MYLIADFAFPLPVYVISEILGGPPADRDLVRQWSLDIAPGLDSPPASPHSSGMPRPRLKLPCTSAADSLSVANAPAQ
jgi:cytochrome P450